MQNIGEILGWESDEITFMNKNIALIAWSLIISTFNLVQIALIVNIVLFHLTGWFFSVKMCLKKTYFC